MKYRVTLESTVDMYQVVEVEAENEEQAKKLAMQRASESRQHWDFSAEYVNADSLAVNDIEEDS